MEINLPILLIIEVLNDQPVDPVAVLIGANIFIYLNESPKPLSHVSASLIDQIRVLA